MSTSSYMLGKQITRLIQEKREKSQSDYSLTDLAKDIGVHHSVIYNILNGTKPKWETVVKIINFFRESGLTVTLDEVAGFEKSLQQTEVNVFLPENGKLIFSENHITEVNTTFPPNVYAIRLTDKNISPCTVLAFINPSIDTHINDTALIDCNGEFILAKKKNRGFFHISTNKKISDGNIIGKAVHISIEI